MHKIIDEALVEHRIRLENGVKVFADVKERFTNVDQAIAALQPKPLNWYAVIAVAVTATVALFGANWALSERFAARPTRDEVRLLVSEGIKLKPLEDEIVKQARRIAELDEHRQSLSKRIDQIQSSMGGSRR